MCGSLLPRHPALPPRPPQCGVRAVAQPLLPQVLPVCWRLDHTGVERGPAQPHRGVTLQHLVPHRRRVEPHAPRRVLHHHPRRHAGGLGLLLQAEGAGAVGAGGRLPAHRVGAAGGRRAAPGGRRLGRRSGHHPAAVRGAGGAAGQRARRDQRGGSAGVLLGWSLQQVAGQGGTQVARACPPCPLLSHAPHHQPATSPTGTSRPASPALHPASK